MSKNCHCNQPIRNSCNCPYCNESYPNNANQSANLSGKICASKQLFWLLSSPSGTTSPIPFDQLCMTGNTMFMKDQHSDIVILKQGNYCINFDAASIVNESTPAGYSPMATFINIISTLKGTIASIPAPVNGQPLAFCRQLLLNAGEIIHFELQHQDNTETKLIDYKISVKNVNGNGNCCQESEQTQSASCDC